jgi:hypothetical protein
VLHHTLGGCRNRRRQREYSYCTDPDGRAHHRLALSRLSAVSERLLRRWQMAELIIPQGDRSGHLYRLRFHRPCRNKSSALAAFD